MNKLLSKFRPGFVLRSIAVLLVVSSFVFFSSCRTEGEESILETSSREVVDDLGKSIRLPQKVTRAVSLAPNLTEIVFAVGAGDRLVGVTSFCNYPQKATKLRKVGDTLKPNIETIVALKPQVVFVSTDSQLEAFSDTIEKQGISVFVTNPSSMDEIYKSIEKIGAVFGEEGATKELIATMKKRVSVLREKTKGVEKVRTFLQVDKSPFTIGNGSFLTDLIDQAGGISVTNDVDKAYFKISRERVAALNPSVIILSKSKDNNSPNSSFNDSEAVKNKRVYEIDADILSRPGPRIVDALEEIAKNLHPDNFE